MTMHCGALARSLRIWPVFTATLHNYFENALVLSVSRIKRVSKNFPRYKSTVDFYVRSPATTFFIPRGAPC